MTRHPDKCSRALGTETQNNRRNMAAWRPRHGIPRFSAPGLLVQAFHTCHQTQSQRSSQQRPYPSSLWGGQGQGRMPREGGWPTFWESTGTFSTSGLQRWWGVKGGHCVSTCTGHGGSGAGSFCFEFLLARAVHWGSGVHWSLHTLVWHLKGQHCEGGEP